MQLYPKSGLETTGPVLRNATKTNISLAPKAKTKTRPVGRPLGLEDLEDMSAVFGSNRFGDSGLGNIRANSQ